MASAAIPATGQPQQSTRFLWLYAAAVAGGAVAYVPFLTILLPIHVSSLAGDGIVQWLSWIALAGAGAASVANIGFGCVSDLTANRRGWALAGFALSSALLLLMPSIESFPALLGAIVAWQLALNMMLAPIAAWAGDCVPDDQKGRLGGMLAFAPATGALSGVLVTSTWLVPVEMRFPVVVALVGALVLPGLLLARPVPTPGLMTPVSREEIAERDALRSRPAVFRMWLARLLVQVAEASLFAFFLLWFRSISPSSTENTAATIFGLVLASAVPFALVVGRWSDRANRPILPLGTACLVSSIGLVIMAMAGDRNFAIAGYVAFGLAASVVLALHTSQTLRVLPRPQTRGRDLGIFNLTNTMPSMIMPWLTLLLVPVFGFSGLFIALAVLVVAAGALLLSIARTA
ncbi:MFS transporter [Alteriqipengyuania flavescens]|uniref:MFS transporter n=1 Tax=Alteriqipengyuania flavescens TaxID=3053610 RepID=UPI0025B404D6|nr:MFS transporter [Alteriqipengyuania flavescens]WJY18219.1 MFS transporter [Alteriqipengyuania flavescens]WJY24160.1 MFS transporter [Alteriqipengyuania flavescens]